MVTHELSNTVAEDYSPVAKRALNYCYIPCRIAKFPFTVQPWILWLLDSQKSSLVYRFINAFIKREKLRNIPKQPPEKLLTSFNDHRLLLTLWIYKQEWNKKYKLPRLKKETTKFLALEGAIWLQVLELCRGLIGYENEDKAIGLWGAAFFEDKIYQLEKIYNPSKFPSIRGNTKKRKAKDSQSQKTRQNNGKQPIKQAFQEQNQQLREGTNPFCPNSQPWLRSIIQASLDILSEQNNRAYNFKNKFWEPYLSSRCKWVNSLEEKGISFLWAEDDEWYSRPQTSKRGKQKILNSSVENSLASLCLTRQEFHELSHSLIYPPKNRALYITNRFQTILDSGDGILIAFEACNF